MGFLFWLFLAGRKSMRPKYLTKDIEMEDLNGFASLEDETFLTMNFKDTTARELQIKLNRVLIENLFIKRENKMLRNEMKYLKETISDKMDEYNARLELIIKFQTKIPKIYYIGLPFGLLGLIIGIFDKNLLYAVAGIGISLTAIAGILELMYGAKTRRAL